MCVAPGRMWCLLVRHAVGAAERKSHRVPCISVCGGGYGLSEPRRSSQPAPTVRSARPLRSSQLSGLPPPSQGDVLQDRGRCGGTRSTQFRAYSFTDSKVRSTATRPQSCNTLIYTIAHRKSPNRRTWLGLCLSLVGEVGFWLEQPPYIQSGWLGAVPNPDRCLQTNSRLLERSVCSEDATEPAPPCGADGVYTT